MKKVVITGGTKLVGSHLAELLLQKGYDVHVTGMFKKGRDEKYLVGATVHVCDVRDVEAMKKICEGAEYVFHLAALGNVIQEAIDSPIETESVNVGGTLSALEAARSVGVKKFVFISSAAVYGEQKTVPFSEDMTVVPMDPYGLYKYFGEQIMRLWAEEYKVPTVSLRVFNAYGPRNPVGQKELVVGRFLDLRLKGQPLTIVGDGSSTRDYVHVKDIATAALLAAENPDICHGEVFNIGSGVETSLKELVSYMGGEVVYLDSLEGSHAGPSRRVADISKAKTLLHWTPTVDLKSGIDELKRELGIN